jgi:hypothetical protein
MYVDPDALCYRPFRAVISARNLSAAIEMYMAIAHVSLSEAYRIVNHLWVQMPDCTGKMLDYLQGDFEILIKPPLDNLLYEWSNAEDAIATYQKMTGSSFQESKLVIAERLRMRRTSWETYIGAAGVWTRQKLSLIRNIDDERLLEMLLVDLVREARIREAENFYAFITGKVTNGRNTDSPSHYIKRLTERYIRELVESGHKVQAMKYYRHIHRNFKRPTLNEAKAAVEQIALSN